MVMVFSSDLEKKKGRRGALESHSSVSVKKGKRKGPDRG